MRTEPSAEARKGCSAAAVNLHLLFDAAGNAESGTGRAVPWFGGSELIALHPTGGLRWYQPWDGVAVEILPRPDEVTWVTDWYTVPATLLVEHDRVRDASFAMSALRDAADTAVNSTQRPFATEVFDTTGQSVVDFLRDIAFRKHEVLRVRLNADLNMYLDSVHVERYGGAFPFQAEGTWAGYQFYFRYRHSLASLQLAPGNSADSAVAHPWWSASVEYGASDDDGEITLHEFVYLFTLLGARLAHSDYTYTFGFAPHAHTVLQRHLESHTINETILVQAANETDAWEELTQRVATHPIAVPHGSGGLRRGTRPARTPADLGFTIDDFVLTDTDKRDYTTVANPSVHHHRVAPDPNAATP